MACIAKNNPQEKKNKGRRRRRQAESSVFFLSSVPALLLLRAPLRRGLPSLDSRRVPSLSPFPALYRNRRLAPFQTAQDYFTQGPEFSTGGMSSTSPSESPTSTQRESTTANDNARPQDPGTDSAGSARSRLSLQLDQRSLHFAVNAWVFIVAVIGILPFATRQLQYKGYRLSLLGTTCTTGYALFALFRLPRVGNTQAVQAWGHHVTSSKDFIPFMYCLMFVTSKLHLKLVLVPVICWALEHVTRFLRRHFTNSSLYRAYLEPLCTWVETNTTAVNFLIANAEILLGFLLILSLFSKQRNAMQTFMYWQLLKLMYHSPFTAGYHRAIWLKIGRTVNPYIHSYTPFLHDPINTCMRWWFR